MKATLEFTLPDEEAEYRIATKARMYHSALCEVSNAVRTRLKYGNLGDEVNTVLRELQQLLWDSTTDDPL